MTFENTTVMITGAAGHLGRVVAAEFARQGARLALVDRSAAALQDAFGEAPEQALLAADLLEADRVREAVDAAVQRFGAVDVLCNLAGGFRMGEAVHETTDRTWDLMLDVNARTVLNTARAAVPHMIERGGGRIVNVGAYAALHGAARMAAYVASKGAVIRLTESMAEELRERGINVNCVLPTIIDTADNRAAMPDADPARWVPPQALADVIVFLASPAARAIHGASIPVRGLS